MKTQEMVFSTFSVEDEATDNLLSVWRNAFLKVKGEWKNVTLIRAVTGDSKEVVEICLDDEQVKRLKEKL